MYRITYIAKDGLRHIRLFSLWYDVENFIRQVNWTLIEDLGESNG